MTGRRSHGDPGGDEVALVQHKDQVLPRLLLLDVSLDVLRAGAHGVAGVQHLDDHVGRVDHLSTAKGTKMKAACVPGDAPKAFKSREAFHSRQKVGGSGGGVKRRFREPNYNRGFLLTLVSNSRREGELYPRWSYRKALNQQCDNNSNHLVQIA